MSQTVTPHARIRLLMWLLLLVAVIFVIRLFYLQIIRHDYYVARASEEQIKQLIIPAQRGEIYALDRGDPVKLVLNERVFTVYADPEEVTDPQAIEAAVREIAGGTAEKNIAKRAAAKPSRYQIVARNVTMKQAELLKKKDLDGLGFQQASRRIYPEGKLAAQVLGFVNAESKGQYGIEEGQDSRLKGTDGLRRSVTDIANVPLTIGTDNIDVPPKHGDNIVLTIDRNVQSFTEQALRDAIQEYGATKASAVVMDPQTGRVLAMANYPTYNPEHFTKVTNAEAFNNGTISTPYEPGSVMKTFTMATAIDKGVMKPSSTYINTDSIRVGDRTINNAAKGYTGRITMQTALNWSLNTGSVTVAQWLGNGNSITLGARNTMYNYFHDRFGLGEPTNIQLANEVPGRLISPSDPEGNEVRYSNMTFGQGLDVTMLQISTGFSAMINGGKYRQPTIIAGKVTDDGAFEKAPGQKVSRQVISPNASRTIKQMVHDARETSYKTQDKSGYDIGGKTGTSQGIVNGKYTFDRTIGTYLGYGGDTKPRYVIMVQISGDGKFEGNTHAAPVFATISNWMIDYMGLQPKG